MKRLKMNFFFLVVTGSVDVGTNGDNLKYICVLMQILSTGVLRVRCSWAWYIYIFYSLKQINEKHIKLIFDSGFLCTLKKLSSNHITFSRIQHLRTCLASGIFMFFLKKIIFYIFRLFWYVNVKNIFFYFLKNYYFNIFLNKKYFNNNNNKKTNCGAAKWGHSFNRVCLRLW